MATSPSSPAVRPDPLDSSARPTRVNRRRQRSVRVTVAVALLSVSTVAVLAALPTQSAAWLSAAAVVSLVFGWAAARIVYSELVQSRRDAAADRSAQANAYRSLFSERAEEHAKFTTAMTDRLVRRDREVAELEATVVLAEKRAIEAETRVQREARRANEAQELVAELQERLEIRQAEEADQLAGWDPELDTVVDLLAWEERVAAGTLPEQAEQKHA
jgi:Skp family chaperone for outer membrane proteins